MKKQYDIALVEWQDAASGHGWHDRGGDHGVGNCVSVGVIVRKNRTCVTLAQCLASTGEQNNAFSIPRGCIRSVKLLGKALWPKEGSTG